MNDGKTRRRLHEQASPEAEPYHALSPDACLSRLGVTAKGLMTRRL